MYEVVEARGEWIVLQGGREVARYAVRAKALEAVADHMRRDDVQDRAVSFSMRFESRAR